MKPAPHKTTWQVYTTNDTYNQGGATFSLSWAWVAHGPRGHDAGVEETSEAAVGKAYAAAMLLSEPKAAR